MVYELEQILGKLDKMFAALFVICFIFTVVTKILDRVKCHVLRWQNGAVKNYG